MDKKTQPKVEDKKKGCQGCGSSDVMLTEEVNAVPRCAGCGQPIKR